MPPGEILDSLRGYLLVTTSIYGILNKAILQCIIVISEKISNW